MTARHAGPMPRSLRQRRYDQIEALATAVAIRVHDDLEARREEVAEEALAEVAYRLGGRPTPRQPLRLVRREEGT